MIVGYSQITRVVLVMLKVRQLACFCKPVTRAATGLGQPLMSGCCFLVAKNLNQVVHGLVFARLVIVGFNGRKDKQSSEDVFFFTAEVLING